MGFRLKSGNRTSFKTMGGSEKSPAKHGTTDDFLYGRNGHNPDTMEGKHEDWHTDKIEAEKKKPSPGKHFVDDVPDHNDGHPDDLQTPEEHEAVKSPAKQTATTWADGTKKSKRQVEEQKIHPDEYWYKINGKPATKAEYMEYQNKPGGDEPGKQTNDPNVSLAKQSADKRTKINK